MGNFILAFVGGFATSAALIVAIGAQNLFVLRQGLRQEHVAAIVLFCASADASLIVAGVAGVGRFAIAAPELTTMLTLGGAVFLGWHGIDALRRLAAANPVLVAETDRLTLGRAMAVTAGFTFLNPHVYLDTVLLLGTVGSAQPASLRPFFAAGAVSASFLWFTILGFGGRLLKSVFARPTSWRLLDLAVATIMLTLAATMVARAIR
jgi:L-lysine exporter family protein LysE/ArgO